MNLADSIFFWSAAAAAGFLAVSGILALFRLRLRVWVREPVTVLIAAGGMAGLLQLILHIPQAWLRISVIVLWAAALLACVILGTLWFAFHHRFECRRDYNGKMCIAEAEEVINGSLCWCYYEARGLFCRGTELLHMGR